MAYTVLARKYRSLSFADVVGQDSVATTMKNAIKTGRVAHAYLFNGTRGVGKTTMARILAKALNCLNAEDATTEPCCQCESCLHINTGDDIDVLEIDGASNNGVDQVRELRDNAIYRPARSRYKIYIIDEVHMLTVAAFNALLKILEEPPAHVKFIFATTEPNKVLATIQSRCQRFDFRNISAPDIAKQLRTVLKLEKIEFQDDLVLALAKMANGSMRDSLSLLDRLISTGIAPLNLDLLEEFLGLPNVEKMFNLIGFMGDSQGAETLLAIDNLITSGLTESQILDSLIECMRDLLVLKTAPKQTELVILTADQLKKAQAVAGKFDIAALVYAISSLEKNRWAIKNSDTPRVLLEASALRFALSDHFINVDTLMAQLGNQPTPSPLKKKSPDESQSVVSLPARSPILTQTAPTAQPPVVPARPVTSVAAILDTAAIQSQWPSILSALNEQLGPGTGSLMQNTTAMRIKDGALTILFPSSGKIHKEMCENSERAEKISRVISACVRSELRLIFSLDQAEKSTAQPTDHQAEAKAVREKRNALLNDPAVKTVLMGLNATVTGIEEQPTDGIEQTK